MKMKFVAVYLTLSCVLSACVQATASFTSSQTPVSINDINDRQTINGDSRDETDQKENVKDSQYSRHLVATDTECVLYLKAVQYENGDQEDSWSCEFSPAYAKQFGGSGMMDIEGISKDELDAHGAISGETIIRIGGLAFIDLPRWGGTGKVSLHIPPASNYAVKKMDEKIDLRHSRNRRGRLRQRRKLNSTLEYSETYKVLVVRVIDAAGKGPDAGAAELQDDIFNDDVCLKRQYEACSHHQIRIERANDFSTIQMIGDKNETVSGIVEVKVDILADNGKAKMLEYRALEAAEQTFGTMTPLAEAFDLVMFCQPPGTGDWLAYAYVNDYRSFYNNKWCQRLSAQMHEVGHNLNLAHSGLPNDSEYADKSGMMGFSYNVDNGPIQCFNPAKSFQLGWYEKQILSFNPLDFIAEARNFILNGVADYETDGSNGDALVSLRLEHEGLDGGVDYYIGYNRQKGCNSGTEQVPNMVTLTEKENPNIGFNDPLHEGRDGYGLTRRIAALNAGQSHTIVDYAGTSSDVILMVNYIRGKDASITIITTEPKPTEPPTTCGGSTLQIKLLTDEHGAETRWSIRDDEASEIIVQSSETYESNTEYILPSPTTSNCVTAGKCYTFAISDRAGDGLCCGFGRGYYQGFLDGTEIFKGGEFDYRDVVQFCVPYNDKWRTGSRVPTNPPTRFPTNTPTILPTLYPSNTAAEPDNFPTSTSPTQTPTKEPSILPSSTPSMGPSNYATVIPPGNPSTQPSLSPSCSLTILPSLGPTLSPTVNPEDQSRDCVDDPTFRFKKKKKWTCRWVKKGSKSRTKGLCNKTNNGILISDICRKTCGKFNLGPCPKVRTKDEQVTASIFIHK